MQNRNQTFSVAQTAKLVKFPGGEKKFFFWLREQGYLYHDNEPFQIYIDKGWFEVVLTKKYAINPHFPKMVTRVTIKGIAGLDKAIKKHYPPCKQVENGRN